MTEFIGFEVEIITAAFETLSGIVAYCDDSTINLSSPTINRKEISQPELSIDATEIRSIKVLSTAVNRKQVSQNSDGVKRTPSSRELRRERLKKIPGAITAYVCDKSPPRVVKTPQPQMINHRVTSLDDLNRSYKGQNVVKDDSLSSNRCKNTPYLNQNLQSDSASGIESDYATSKPIKHTGRRSKLRGRRNSSRQNDCFSLRVEDFPETEFDFEANLAKFDKKAFYEMTDAKCGGDNGKNCYPLDLSPELEHILIEGPNGIGYVTAPVAKTVMASTPVKASSGSPAPSFSSGSNWFTPSGKRVPVVAPSVLDRALQFLATGWDPTGITNSLPMGLSWTRIIEMAGQAIKTATNCFNDAKFNFSQAAQSQSHPLRVLVLPGEENWSGALALNLARHLANRDSACVLLHNPPSPTSSSAHRPTPPISSHPFPTYSEELILAQTLTPQSSSLFHPNRPLNQSFRTQDSSGDEESFEDEVIGSFAKEGNLKYSTRRLWTGRIPGLILVTKSPSSIARQLTSAHIDLLVLGQPLEEYSAETRQWLENIKGIGWAIQLGALRPPFRANSLVPSQALRRWVIQLGLPVASPMQVNDSLEVHLVDVGLNKWILSRMTTDQRSFPPPGMFETSPCIRLMSDSNGTA
ncbi:unnamed protein product [Rodentolepis nana]|uniref:Enhancer of mRNA-decapping protein 3 n=1 Tax=Rodentolepis nana TaxID=102285 RepID=A0A0R3TK78_RODNA|nr:unnamed protein product [Rodentolepis nana]